MKKIFILSISFFIFISLIGICKQVSAQSDLYISEFSLEPSSPIQGREVSVRIGVYNQGNDWSDDFTLEWLPTENAANPGCTWRVHSLPPKGGRIFTCTNFYASWYSNIKTKAVADSKREVREQNENNNAKSIQIRVLKPIE
jgi:hypothetical protein